METHIQSLARYHSRLIEEYLAARDRIGYIDRRRWTKIQITGPDRKSFLHGLVTNEVKKLNAGEGNYSLMLTPQGKVLADLWVYDVGESLWILSHENLHDEIVSFLNKYLIMEEAVIVDQTDAFYLFTVVGPESVQFLSKYCSESDLPSSLNSIKKCLVLNSDCLVIRYVRGLFDGYHCLVSSQTAEPFLELLDQTKLTRIGDEVIDILRIESGIPLCKRDIDDRVIPQEALLHDAISFTKGCYIGQEVVARLHFRGHVNRELTGFYIDAEGLPGGPLRIEQEGKEVGKITSHCFSIGCERMIGIGFLRRELKTTGAQLRIEQKDQMVRIEVAELPVVKP